MTDITDDPIYALLSGARSKMNADLTETLTNAAGVMVTHGPEVHRALCDRLIEEHAMVMEELNRRIVRRIVELNK